MKKSINVLIIASLFLSGCAGFNNIMRKHLSNSDNYKSVKAVFNKYMDEGDKIYIFISNDEHLESISLFDQSEHQKELIRLSLIGDNYNNLKNVFTDEEIIFGTTLTIKTATLIYMDSTFYYIAELEAEGITYLSFDDGLSNIVNYMDKNKSLF